MSSDVRRRRRTVEERIGAQLRHGKPGDLAGRGEPLKRDQGARVSRAGGVAGDTGPTVEHVVLHATAQTIADGGAAPRWSVIDGPPTERRGFATLSATIAADDDVADIPVDLTGELEMVLDGLWTSYRATGEITITRLREGADDEARTFELGPVTSRMFGGVTLGWAVKAGDKVRVELPNGSGEGQSLSEATIGLRVIEVRTSTSDLPQATPIPAPWAWYRADDAQYGAGGNIVRIDDRTSGGRDLVIEDSVDRNQLYSADALDGHAAVVAEAGAGSARGLQADFDAVTFPDGMTLLEIYKDPTGGQSQATVGLGFAGGPEIYSESSYQEFAFGGWGVGGAAAGFDGNAWHAGLGTIGPDQVALYFEGVEFPTGASGYFNTPPSSGDWGALDPSEFTLMRAREPDSPLVEFIVWDRILDAAERARVWQYVAERYPSIDVTT